MTNIGNNLRWGCEWVSEWVSEWMSESEIYRCYEWLLVPEQQKGKVLYLHPCRLGELVTLLPPTPGLPPQASSSLPLFLLLLFPFLSFSSFSSPFPLLHFSSFPFFANDRGVAALCPQCGATRLTPLYFYTKFRKDRIQDQAQKSQISH